MPTTTLPDIDSPKASNAPPNKALLSVASPNEPLPAVGHASRSQALAAEAPEVGRRPGRDATKTKAGRAQSPLVQGSYESEMLSKLHALRVDGYAKKHTKGKPLSIEAPWREFVPDPPGRHVSQRATVAGVVGEPLMERTVADHKRCACSRRRRR